MYIRIGGVEVRFEWVVPRDASDLQKADCLSRCQDGIPTSIDFALGTTMQRQVCLAKWPGGGALGFAFWACFATGLREIPRGAPD